jgi:medium-chain acyl-[acyl-carrier-protein] hydrolase
MTSSSNEPPRVELRHLGGATDAPVLICTPHAGGGTGAFRSWPKLVPSLNFYALSLPGREGRLNQAPFTDIHSLVGSAVRAITPLTRRPFALFGHSMGGLISFEIARLLRKQNAAVPMYLFVSSFRAPHLPDRKSPRFSLPHAQFIEELRSINGPELDLDHHSELVEMMLSTVRADFHLVETYTHKPEPPLICPITVYGGLADSEVNEGDLRDWSQHTSAAFRMTLFPGGHLFLTTQARAILVDLYNQLGSLPATSSAGIDAAPHPS